MLFMLLLHTFQIESVSTFVSDLNAILGRQQQLARIKQIMSLLEPCDVAVSSFIAVILQLIFFTRFQINSGASK